MKRSEIVEKEAVKLTNIHKALCGKNAARLRMLGKIKFAMSIKV